MDLGCLEISWDSFVAQYFNDSTQNCLLMVKGSIPINIPPVTEMRFRVCEVRVILNRFRTDLYCTIRYDFAHGTNDFIILKLL